MHFLTLPRRQKLAHCFTHLGCARLVRGVLDTLTTNGQKQLLKFFSRCMKHRALVKGGPNVIVILKRHNVGRNRRPRNGAAQLRNGLGRPG